MHMPADSTFERTVLGQLCAGGCFAIHHEAVCTPVLFIASACEPPPTALRLVLGRCSSTAMSCVGTQAARLSARRCHSKSRGCSCRHVHADDLSAAASHAHVLLRLRQAVARH